MAESNTESGSKTFEELFISELVFASVVKTGLWVSRFNKFGQSLAQHLVRCTTASEQVPVCSQVTTQWSIPLDQCAGFTGFTG